MPVPLFVDAHDASVVLGDGGAHVRTVAVGRPGALAQVALGSDVQDRPGGFERRDGALVEWWAGTAEGPEQGWTLGEPPSGDGPLQVVVEVRGGDWSLGALAAWDAGGRTLPLAFARSPGGYTLTVDDRGARYPVTIDPIYATPVWEGFGVAGAVAVEYVDARCDVDGDGLRDLVAGDGHGALVYAGVAGGFATTATSALDAPGKITCAGDLDDDGFDDLAMADDHGVFVVRGPLAPMTALPSPEVEFVGLDSWSGFVAVDAAGDVDQDGYGDLIAGGPDGAVWFRGGPGALAATWLPLADGVFVPTVLGATDVDQDGYDDVVLVATSDLRVEATLALYRGSASGLVASTTLAAESWFGETLAAADVNGDGFPDVAVGDASSDDVANVHVFPGTAMGLGAQCRYVTSAWGAGMTVASAGDLDADGFDDVLVGSPVPVQGKTSVGVLYGDGSCGTFDDAVLTSSSSDAGRALAGVGDLDGDGFHDAVAMCNGALSVYEGSAEGLGTTPQSNFQRRAGERMGRVYAAGDVNGDGALDVITAGHQDRLAVFLGGMSGDDAPDQVLVIPDVTTVGATLGAGDVNGDGYDDVVVSAADGSTIDVAFVFHGSAAGVAVAPTSTLTGTVPYDQVLALPVGDVDADGYEDVVSVGERARLWFGSASGLVTSAPVTLSLPGRPESAAAAGDVDGDGFGDVVIGYRGGAAVVYGASDGVRGHTALTHSSSNFGGYGATGVGDVNGDGYDDVAVLDDGPPLVRVFLGSATGAQATPVASLEAEVGDATTWSPRVYRLGDLDGDGYDDVGTSYLNVFHGGPAGPATTATQSLYVPGGCVALGDVNDDGLGDVLCGDSRGPAGGGGRVFVLVGEVDADGDDFGVSVDCDDTDAAIGDGWYWVDLDGDGLGDGDADRVQTCATDAANVATNGDDCDDTSSDVGLPVTVFTDNDLDGYGDDTLSFSTCGDPDVPGLALQGGDCDDAEGTVHPGGTEVPEDGVDQDCSGSDATDDPPDTDPPDTDDPPDTEPSDTDDPPADEGCGCASAPTGAPALLALVGLAARRRRARRVG